MDGLFAAFCAPCALLFARRGAQNCVGVFATLQDGTRTLCPIFWLHSVCLFAAKYALNVGTRRGRAFYFIHFARFFRFALFIILFPSSFSFLVFVRFPFLCFLPCSFAYLSFSFLFFSFFLFVGLFVNIQYK